MMESGSLRGRLRVIVGVATDAKIRSDPALIEEARELVKSFAKSVQTTRANTIRIKVLPKS